MVLNGFLPQVGSQRGSVKCNATFIKIPAPNGWYDAENGTLLATLKKHNELKNTISIPGKEVSAHTLNDIESDSYIIPTSYMSYYVTYGTGWQANGTKFDLTGIAVTSDTYTNSYSNLVGKYLPSSNLYVSGSSTAGTLRTTTGLDSVYYIISATSSSFTYKKITSNKNTTEALLASTPDDYGTSYYFRGAVKNNYIQFANQCWRIVRITGDGSVKLVLHNYNLRNRYSNPCSSSYNSGTSAFINYSNFNTEYNDNAYIGFMYGSAGSNDYASTHTNINKSTILTNLETWYTNNLAEYENKLADTIWCNDKSTFTVNTNGTTYGTGLGYGTDTTGYSSLNRLYGGEAATYASPSLICPNDNNGGKLSKFTVDDTSKGNGNLTYKIGLLTADEVVFAGNTTYSSNSSTYLWENTEESIHYWTMTPAFFESNIAGMFLVAKGERLYALKTDPRTLAPDLNKQYIRPSISLTSSTTISGGSGTSEDPYIVD